MQKVGRKYKTCFDIYDTGLVIPAVIIERGGCGLVNFCKNDGCYSLSDSLPGN